MFIYVIFVDILVTVVALLYLLSFKTITIAVMRDLSWFYIGNQMFNYCCHGVICFLCTFFITDSKK
jgi:hypothetical protein